MVLNKTQQRLEHACIHRFAILFYQSLAEQILDMEDVCGQFPKDAYFVHGGKPVST